MSEFNNRIAAQRDILLIVNSGAWQEELFGLSCAAIDRWIDVNRLDRQSRLVQLISQAADRLFFLANKSQEQITEDYRSLSVEVSALTARIRVAVDQFTKH